MAVDTTAIDGAELLELKTFTCSVASSAVPLSTAADIVAIVSMDLRAASSNSSVIWIGSPSVTAGVGLRLAANGTKTYDPIGYYTNGLTYRYNLRRMYAISDTTVAQTLYVVAIVRRAEASSP